MKNNRARMIYWIYIQVCAYGYERIKKSEMAINSFIKHSSLNKICILCSITQPLFLPYCHSSEECLINVIFWSNPKKNTPQYCDHRGVLSLYRSSTYFLIIGI